MKNYFVHESAYLDDPCEIGDGTKIWHFCHISRGARIGQQCTIGQNVFVGNDVTIGDRVKIQNNVSIYTGTVIEDEVFFGPSSVTTNITNPRSQINRHSLYEQTVFRRGATIGANATILCGIELGRYCFIAAGAVVTGNVPDYALIKGVPGRLSGWMSRHGHLLEKRHDEKVLVCPESGYRYREIEPGIMRCLDLDENEPLPADKASGIKPYDAFKE